MVECREPEVLASIGVELRPLLVAPPRRLAVLLAAYAARNLVARGQPPCIYARDEKLLDAVLSALEALGVRPERVVSVRELKDCRGFPTIALYPRPVVQGLDYRLLVVDEKPGVKLELRRVQARVVQPGVYRLKIGVQPVLLEEVEGRLCEPREEPLLERVGRVIEEALREYGPLPVRDVVQLIAGELGVTKTEARKLLYAAVQAGYARIDSGYVTPP